MRRKEEEKEDQRRKKKEECKLDITGIINSITSNFQK